MRWRTSSSASSRDSSRKRSASSGPRPIVLPSKTPETLNDSCTSDEISASVFWRSVANLRRSTPTRRVNRTKNGTSITDKIARRQSSKNIATTAASTVVTFETTDVAVEVTTSSTPPMSFEMRDCTSPVRVRVKNASD